MVSEIQYSTMAHLPIPIFLQETPLFYSSKVIQPVISANLFDTALDFVTQLQKAFQQNDNELKLYSLYFSYFPKATKQHNGIWPFTYEIQGKYQTANFTAKTTDFYQQLILWHNITNNRTEQQSQFIERSKQKYEDIFNTKSNINLPFVVLWSIFERFLQIYKLKSQEFFTKEEATLLLSSPNKDATRYFIYYSKVTLTSVHIYEKQYSLTLTQINTISLEDLVTAPKCFNAYLQIFYNGILAYFQERQYEKGARLGTACVNFFDKNKKYLLHFNEKKFQSIQLLLLFHHIFLQEKYIPNSEALSLIYMRLKQNDIETFKKYYKIVSNGPIEDNVRRFEELEAISLNTILQNYTQIELKRVSKLLKISEEEVKEKLEKGQKLEDSTWNKSVMSGLMTRKRKITIENEIIKLDFQDQEIVWSNNEIIQLINKVNLL